MQKEVFTTTQVGKICSTGPAQPAKWIDSGFLVGHRIPGSSHRRVNRKDLVFFLFQHGIPPDRISLFDT